ncbi:unnamed protein product [Leptidea sinapis]|uniref:Uncharacterized protein n=1 Tax=Leptidea sinapis TaxID=189913 RepID=A0A5E4PYG2_9NEOP|nr:unnamed protein product [Leptidea sinapis]
MEENNNTSMMMIAASPPPTHCYTCGWSRCDCNGDKLLDEISGNCVEIQKCPKISLRASKRNKEGDKKRKQRKNKVSKRVKIVEEDLRKII